MCMLPTAPVSSRVLQPVEETITCCVCHDVLTDPVFVCEAQHTVDRRCIEDWSIKNPSCPECRESLQKPFKDNLSSKRTIDGYWRGLRRLEEEIVSLEQSAKSLTTEHHLSSVIIRKLDEDPLESSHPQGKIDPMPKEKSLSKVEQIEIEGLKRISTLDSNLSLLPKSDQKDLLRSAFSALNSTLPRYEDLYPVLPPPAVALPPIFGAVMRGDEDAVSSFIQRGGSVNQEDIGGHNLIFYAKTDGMVELLLRAGAVIKRVPSQLGTEQNNRLFQAVETNQLVLTKELLENGLSNIEATREILVGYGLDKQLKAVRALMVAIKTSPIMMLLLVRAGAKTEVAKTIIFSFASPEPANLQIVDIEIDDIKIDRALAKTSKTGMTDVIQKYIDRLKERNDKERYELLTPSNEVPVRQFTVSLELPKDGEQITLKILDSTKKWIIPLLLKPETAALLDLQFLEKLSSVVAELENNRADPFQKEDIYGLNTRNNTGETPLTASCKLGDDLIEVTRFLVSRKPNLDLPNYLGDSPVLIASKKKAVKTVQFLIESGANLDFPDKDGITAREHMQRDKEVFKEILDNRSKCIIA